MSVLTAPTEWSARARHGSDGGGPHPGGGGVLAVLYSFPFALGAPGIGFTAWNQANELVRAGVDVHIVVASVEKPIEGAASVRTTLTVRGRRVPHRAIGRDRAMRIHDAVTARLVGRLLDGSADDVVHAWPLASARTLRAARRRGIPGVREVPNTHTAHAYEVVAREYAALGLEPPRGGSHTGDARRLATEESEYAAAVGLLVPSEAVAGSFLDRGFENDRLLRHRYGCTVTAPPARGDGGRPFTAVFLGRGSPRKGLHTALQAWTASRAAAGGRFLVYGLLDDDYAAFLAPLLAHPSVEVRGVTPEPMSVLAAADVLLLPTVEEGSALVTYEAQVAGCVPLVSTAAGAVIDEGVTGLTHRVGDLDALTEQLDLLAARPEMLARMSRAAMARADELSWAAAIQATLAAYREAARLMGRSSHAAA
ncbi:glycosyltransferase family 4 protein [Microbacterium sp. QXD-8]|uniref:Glycosyltransferase family 4 protein n=1 Tax=Microbacterium psychrotolerans TaxID=3068321 RepID=A0ABU0Z195_9MICO|nr:glycosyltransferase family 4 protein [Microbacterium sp. QXD-8]MDQ7878347.1 glycosyltransferase family 4 protein [Microbacterium sp. QXD-8]